MRILIAPDTFKGSLSAILASAAITRGVHRALPQAHTDEYPMADGGEGSLEILGHTHGMYLRQQTVTDPLGQPLPGRYLFSEDRQRAIVELAVASGLTGNAPNERRPLTASTLGTGELLRSALTELAPGGEITLCLGGSATSDGGAGLLSALGFCFLDGNGHELAPGGAALSRLDRIDQRAVLPAAREVVWKLACDVQTPLLGPQGAAHFFGPQKGATPDEVAQLEAGLSRLADVLHTLTGIRLHDLPGAGAAGGTSGSLHALLGAQLVSGAAQIARSIGLEEAIASGTFDLLLTGEGRLDEQSRHGKVVGVLVELARAVNLPVIALAGAVDLRTPWPELSAAFALAPGPLSLSESQARTGELLEDRAAQVMGVWVAARRE